MGVTVQERDKMRRYSLKGAERRYWIRGAADESAAMTAILDQVGGEVPAALGGFPISPTDIQLDECDTNNYEAVVPWKSPDVGGGGSQQAGSFSVSFDISGQNTRITHAIATINKYHDNTFSTREFNGAINVKPDRTVEGTDIIVPFTTYTLTYTVAPSLITDAYVATLSRLVGKVNIATFKAFAPGELLFTRCSGQKRDKDNWDLCFGFAVSENQDGTSSPGIVIGNINAGHKITKRGWDYLWVYYEEQHDSTGHVTGVVPGHATVVQVYPDADYAALGLP